VFANLSAWFDRRTGVKKLISALLLEHIPGGAKWRYVWGSCLLFVFSIQLVTGILLMTAYSPGDSTSWASVYFIQYKMDFGWLIRGLHHFGSQTMVVLLGLHMLQVVIAGAFLPPREVNWWLGLLLLACVLALSLTGYLLPWDQKGFWATQVATNIAGNLPGPGAFLKKIIVGGNAYGNQTLTRFYALHVGVLPPLVILLTVLHLVVFRRHGVTYPKNIEGDGWFWPDQAFRDLVASLLIFGVMLGLVLYGDGHKVERPEGAPEPTLYEKIAHAGLDGRGANLDAPADPGREYPARPEWYFLFLFQLLKYFEGEQEILGTVVIPNAVFVLLAILPLLGYGWMRRIGHGIGILVVVSVLVGAGALTCLAVAEDTVDPVAAGLIRRVGTVLLPLTGAVLIVMLALLALAGRGAIGKAIYVLGVLVIGVLVIGSGSLLYAAVSNRIPPQVAELVREQLKGNEEKPSEKAAGFRQRLAEADQLAERAVALASQGIPESGPKYLLRRDPLTRGREVFQQNCGSCHNYGRECHNEKANSSDLDGYGTEEWIFRLLTNPGHEDFFGRTGRSTMQDWIETHFPNVAAKPDEVAKLSEDEKKEREKDLNDLRVLAKWLSLHPRGTSGGAEAEELKAGLETFNGRSCKQCHSFAGEGAQRGPGPDLTGYGDADWLRRMIMLPGHPSRYGRTNTMPAFRDLEWPDGEVHKLELERVRDLLLQEIPDDDRKKDVKKKEIERSTRALHLNDIDREIIIRWVVKDYRPVFGGEPIAR
jgi:quinol-cytochrome oxidoreductase complex cytochrome b subunit/mono/diheme cytochrome c family protein